MGREFVHDFGLVDPKQRVLVDVIIDSKSHLLLHRSADLNKGIYIHFLTKIVQNIVIFLH